MFELEHRVLLPDGTFGWTLSRAIPIMDEAGEITDRYVELINQTTDRAARVTTQLLAFARRQALKPESSSSLIAWSE